MEELDDLSLWDDENKPEDMSWTEWRRLKRESERGVRVSKKPKRDNKLSEMWEDSPFGKFKRRVLGINSGSDLIPKKSTAGACCCCLGAGGCLVLIVLIIFLIAAIGFALRHKELFLL